MRHGVEKIVSGGQTGVDRGALDAAIELGVAHGGWCPKGRLSEDGPIPKTYEMTEHESADYAARTEQNVIDSDGTLIIYRERLQGGTALTNRLAKEYKKPLCRIRADIPVDFTKVLNWLSENEIRVLNVAGPRESTSPGMEERTKELLTKLFQCAEDLLE